MTKKRVLRFIKRYVIGLFAMYFLLAIVAYIYLTNINAINADNGIPNFKLENQFGELKSFSDYKGKVLLVDFWFQACQPCLDEMKFFPELLKKYDSELAIMSISVDSKQATEYLLKQKPKPWNFLISDNKSWTFYNDNKSDNSFVKELGVASYPTYLLFNKNGDLISTPFSGIAGVENELSGIFGLDLTFKTENQKKTIEKLPFLIIPYTILAFLILVIQLIIFGVKRLIGKKNTNANTS
jgi:peroxiredoxin